MDKWPSVTTVLKPWSNFDNIPPAVLQEACDRGIALHGAYAGYALGLWVAPLPESYQGFYDSWRRWFDSAVKKVIAIEPKLECPQYHFTGHPDAIIEINGDDCLTLPDWKNGQTELKSWRLQTAAYRHLAKETYGVKRTIIVQPRPDGKMAKVREYTGTVERDFAVFLNCLTAFNFFRKE